MNILWPHRDDIPRIKQKVILPLRRIGLLVLFLLSTAVMLFAQTTTIKGRVLDENRAPVSGVTIQLKNTQAGTSTDNAGNFSLTVPEAKGVLVFTFVGYASREVPITGDFIQVQLQPLNQSLGEVVVVGYSTQRRVSITGAVDKVTSAAISGKPAANLTQALQGVSPNLIIQQRNFEPGQGVNLNIRGLGTLGVNDPLVVIDGIIGGDINLINPNDIDNISILKDAGTAAIYGSRSANGVILITTKKGRKNEKPSLTYNGIYGVTSPQVMAQPVHAWENAYYKNESLVNSGRQAMYSPSEIQQFAAKGDGDWRLDNILQNAAQQTHNISIKGGGENNTYMVSAGYFNQQNNFIGPDYGWKRYNVRLNQTTDIGKFKLTTLLSYVKSDGKDHSSSASTLIVDASRVPLYYSFQDSLGRYLTNAVSAEFNPKAILENGGYRKYNNDEVFGNFTGEYALTSDLKVRGVFGGTVVSNQTFARRIELGFYPGGKYGQDREVMNNNYKSLMTNVQMIAEYKKRFKQHDVNVLVGGSNESYKGESNYLRKTLTDPVFGIPTTGTVVDPGSSNSNQGTNETSLNSGFGRAGYSFADRYFTEFSFRYDGSSNFPKDVRWGFFPSFSAAWRPTEESFLQAFKDKVGDLKVRASYGVLGNQNVTRAYQYQTFFFNYTNAYGFNNTAVGGSGFLLGNPEFTWEKAATFNVGIDATVLNRNLTLTLDYFDKTTRDILVPREDVPLLFGSGFPDYNAAEVNNKGWEASATYKLDGKLFHHTFSANLADNKNKLLQYTFGAKELVVRREEFEFVRRVGQPITMYQGYRRDGFFQTLDDVKNYAKPVNATVVPGDIKFKDKNGDGVIDDQDKYILGNPFPRYTFGFTYNVAVKGFDATVFIQGVGRRDLMLRGELVEPFHFGYGGTMYQHQTDYWTPTNPDAKWPRLAEAGSPSNSNNYRTGSDIYLFDAAYARLKNVQIGYTLPKGLAQKARIQNARLYFTGQNLFTLTKLDFIDPENTEFGNSTNMGSYANSGRAYPLPVFYGVGLDITF